MPGNICACAQLPSDSHHLLPCARSFHQTLTPIRLPSSFAERAQLPTDPHRLGVRSQIHYPTRSNSRACTRKFGAVRAQTHHHVIHRLTASPWAPQGLCSSSNGKLLLLMRSSAGICFSIPDERSRVLLLLGPVECKSTHSACTQSASKC